jgi:hypothetical protein
MMAQNDLAYHQDFVLQSDFEVSILSQICLQMRSAVVKDSGHLGETPEHQDPATHYLPTCEN